MNALILLSGGLDSAANLAIEFERHRSLLCLTFDYGQRAAQSEIRAARGISQYYRAEHKVIEIPFLKNTSPNALTDSKAELPQFQINELDDPARCQDSARRVWIPNRNGVFLNVAAMVAESLGINRVLVGFNLEEARTFPDNSRAYRLALNEAFKYSTANQVQVASHTEEMTKPQIVKRLRSLSKDFPFERLWSCYSSSELPCGSCESCVRLERALL